MSKQLKKKKKCQKVDYVRIIKAIIILKGHQMPYWFKSYSNFAVKSEFSLQTILLGIVIKSISSISRGRDRGYGYWRQWQMTGDIQHVTYDKWYMTHEAWYWYYLHTSRDCVFSVWGIFTDSWVSHRVAMSVNLFVQF